MVISHHIATQLAAERQRDLRSSSSRGWRFPSPFGRRSAEPELEPVPPVEVASASATGGDEPSLADTNVPLPEAPVRSAGRGPARRTSVAAARLPARRRERGGV